MSPFHSNQSAKTAAPTTSGTLLRMTLALMSWFGPAFGPGLLMMGACSSAAKTSDGAAPDRHSDAIGDVADTATSSGDAQNATPNHPSDAIGDVTDTTTLPADAQNGDPALNCAVNYDEQVQRELTRCSTTPYQGTGSCGRYLIVVERYNFDPGAGCFYDATTKTLVSYVYCSDTGSCQSSGAALAAPCGSINSLVSGTIPLCIRDSGGVASDAQSD